MEEIYRFPSVASFEDNDLSSKLFFGRDQEGYALLHYILAEDLTVLFSYSGLGKTSLLQAYIFPKLREEGYYPLLIRLNQKGKNPLQIIKDRISEISNNPIFRLINNSSDSDFSSFIKGLELRKIQAFSNHFKIIQPVFVFDQFEEIFSLEFNINSVDDFFKDLAKVINDSREGVINAKIVISIREDFLGQLEKISTLIPTIFSNRFQLIPLNRKSAEAAIVNPAITNINLKSITNRFQFSEDAKTELLNFLSNSREAINNSNKEEVAPIQLQIICRQLEEKVRKGEIRCIEGNIIIEKADLGGEEGLNNLLGNFYSQELNKLNSELNLSLQEILAIREVIETDLIAGTKRVPIAYDKLISWPNVSKAGIDLLIKTKLLRKEARGNNYLVEISHDTLVEPILVSYNKRIYEASKSYSNLIKQLKTDSSLSISDIQKIQICVEEDLLNSVINKRIFKNYLDLTNDFSGVKKGIDFLIENGILKRDYKHETVQISNDMFVEPILKEKEIRKAQEKLQKEKDADYKKIKRNFLLFIIIFLASIGIYLYIKFETESKVNAQAPYLFASSRSLFTNPTLSYIVAKKGFSIYNKNEKLSELIGSIEKYPFIIQNRFFSTHDYIGFYLKNSNEIIGGNESEIFNIVEKGERKITNSNNDIKTFYSGRRNGYFLRTNPGNNLDTSEIINIYGNLITKFISSTSGSVLAVSDDEKLIFYNGSFFKKDSLRSSKIIMKVKGTNDMMCSNFISNNKYIAVGYWDGSIIIYTTDSGKMIKAFRGGSLNSVVTTLAVTSDNKYLISADRENNIYIWEVGDLTKLKPQESIEAIKIPYKKLVGHLRQINSLAISHDNTKILSGSDDHNAIIWDFNGQLISELRGHGHNIDFVQFSSNDSLIMTASKDGEVLEWGYGNISDYYQRNQLAKFSAFEFNSIGVPSIEINSGIYNTSADLKEQIIMASEYLETLPSQNVFPEIISYSEALAESISELDNIFHSINNNKNFNSLPIQYKKVLLLSIAKFEYKKSELLLNSYKETKEQTEQREYQYNLSQINANLLDTVNFSSIQSNIYNILRLYYLDTNENKSLQRQKAENYLISIINTYKFKFSNKVAPSIIDDYSVLINFYLKKKNFSKAENYIQLALEQYNKEFNLRTYDVYLKLLESNIKSGKLKESKALIYKLWQSDNVLCKYSYSEDFLLLFKKQHKCTNKQIDQFLLKDAILGLKVNFIEKSDIESFNLIELFLNDSTFKVIDL